MQTRVRITEHQFSQGTEYRKFYIELLSERSKYSKELVIYAHLEFQSDKKHEVELMAEGKNHWYGLHYQLSYNCDTSDNILKLAKLAKFIEDNVQDTNNPTEILKVIGAIEYESFEGTFIPKSYNNYQRFKVKQSNGYTYAHLFAPNEIIARKMHAKSEDKDMELVFDKVVNFR